MQNTVHFILQGKGGIGKTLVSTILAQWLAQKDEQPLRCYDTDQENATFSRYKAMNVKHVPVMTDTRNIDPKRFDALMIDILEEDGNCVVDNGANTFSPLMAYLLENDCFALLRGSRAARSTSTPSSAAATRCTTPPPASPRPPRRPMCRWCCGRTSTSAAWHRPAASCSPNRRPTSTTRRACAAASCWRRATPTPSAPTSRR